MRDTRRWSPRDEIQAALPAADHEPISFLLATQAVDSLPTIQGERGRRGVVSAKIGDRAPSPTLWRAPKATSNGANFQTWSLVTREFFFRTFAGGKANERG